MVKRTALLALVGGFAGLIAWINDERMVARIRLMRNSTHSFQATIYGWLGHAWFAAILAGLLAMLICQSRAGWARVVVAGGIAACCGSLFIFGADGISDIIWNSVYGDAYWLTYGEKPLPSLLWNVMVALAITFSIAISAAPTRVRYISLFGVAWLPSLAGYSAIPTWVQASRVLLAGLAAGIIAFFLHVGLATPLHAMLHVVSTDYNEVHNGTVLNSVWHRYSPARLSDFVGLGVVIGLAVGLTEHLGRRALVRVMFPGGEYRDYPIETGSNRIGASEWLEIVLRGDPAVSPNHASIDRSGETYNLVDCASPFGTFLNGQAIRQAPLKNGDIIVVGRFAMQFLN